MTSNFLIDQSFANSDQSLQSSREGQIPVDTMSNKNIPPWLQASPGGDKPSIKGLGTLIALAPEIRNMIWSDVISDGELEILQTSKFINVEAVGILHKKGIFRLNVGYPNRFCRPDSYMNALHLIQNIELRVNLGHDNTGNGELPHFYAQMSNVPLFKDLDFVRQDCFISMEYGLCAPIPRRIAHPALGWTLPRLLFGYLGMLAGFEVVVIKLVPIGLEDGGPPAWSNDEEKIHDTASTAVRAELKDNLGPSTCRKDQDGAYIEFHPRKYGEILTAMNVTLAGEWEFLSIARNGRLRTIE